MKKVWERIVPLTKTDRKWDIDFWQAQSPSIRFKATWLMLIDYYRIRGKKIHGNMLRLQRTVENIKQA